MLSDFQRTKLAYFFNLLDLSKNGELQLNDFSDLSESVRVKLDYEDGGKEHKEIVNKAVNFFYKLLKDIPNTGDQTINCEGWLSFFDEEIEEEDTIDEYVDLIISFIFGLFDENHDGYISISEYQDICEVMGIDKNSAQMAFSKVDINNDGRLSRYELIPAMEQFLSSDNPHDPGNWVFGNWETQKKPAQ